MKLEKFLYHWIVNDAFYSIIILMQLKKSYLWSCRGPSWPPIYASDICEFDKIFPVVTK